MIEDLFNIYETDVGRRQKFVVSTHSTFTEVFNATTVFLAASLDTRLRVRQKLALLTSTL